MDNIKSIILSNLARQLELSYPYYCQLIDLEKFLLQESDEYRTTLAEYKNIMERCNTIFSEGNFNEEDIGRILITDDDRSNKYVTEHLRKYFASLPTNYEETDLFTFGLMSKATTSAEINKRINNYYNYLDADMAINMLIVFARKISEGKISYFEYVDNKYHYLCYSRVMENFLIEHELVVKDDCEMPSQVFLGQQPDIIKAILLPRRNQYLFSKLLLLLNNLHDKLISDGDVNTTIIDTLVEGHIGLLDDEALEAFMKPIMTDSYTDDVIELFKRKAELVKKQRIAKLDKPEA